MEVKAAKRFSLRTDASVFKRLGRVNQENISRIHQVKAAVCKYWLEGRCTRNPCRFLHPDSSKPSTEQSYRADSRIDKSKCVWKNPDTHKEKPLPTKKGQQNTLKNEVNCNGSQTILKTQPSIKKSSQNILKNEEDYSENQRALETEQKDMTSKADFNQSKSIQNKNKLCKYWMTDNCVKGDKCENLHSWFFGNGLSIVAQLEGHTKAITGIALPSRSERLYCGSKDKSLRVWDCHSGHCGAVIDFTDECVTLINEGPWIFAGLRDMIKAWNVNTQSELIIRGSGGQVNAITMYEDVLSAGMEDGTVLSWRLTSETSFSEVATSLKSHTGSVLSLVVGAKLLFSGSADHTIRVWDTESLNCMHVLNGHTDDVTTVLCWDSYLLSGSLDKKIKIWAATESGTIEEVYEQIEDDGVAAFCGMHDTEGKPILLCWCKDNGVRLYDLPSFDERNRVYSRWDIEAMEKGPDGIFFTGDAAGLVTVWRLDGEI